MKTIEQILSEPVKFKPEYAYLDKCHESYRGINRNVYSDNNDDINEALKTAAGIDGYARR